MTESLHIVVLAGGISHERDVSLRSGRRVADALTAAGHRVDVVDPDAALFTRLENDAADLIWPTVHGKTGEDGALLALLATTGIPYIGAHGEDAALAWVKPVASSLVRRAGLATPDSIALSRETFRDLGAASVLGRILGELPLPLVVKPAEGGSAQGVSIVREPGDLPSAMVEAYTYCDLVVVERHVSGVEVAVGVMDVGEGPRALPAVEIDPLSGVYSFDARYNAGETRFYTPARLTEAVAERVADAAVAVHELLRLRRLSRIDFIIDADGVPWFLEANVLPGLTETSLVPQAIEAAGLTLPGVYSALASAAVAATVSRETVA